MFSNLAVPESQTENSFTEILENLKHHYTQEELMDVEFIQSHILKNINFQENAPILDEVFPKGACMDNQTFMYKSPADDQRKRSMGLSLVQLTQEFSPCKGSPSTYSSNSAKTYLECLDDEVLNSFFSESNPHIP